MRATLWTTQMVEVKAMAAFDRFDRSVDRSIDSIPNVPTQGRITAETHTNVRKRHVNSRQFGAFSGLPARVRTCLDVFGRVRIGSGPFGRKKIGRKFSIFFRR